MGRHSLSSQTVRKQQVWENAEQSRRCQGYGGIDLSLNQEDKDLIEYARNVIRKNYDSIHWWHTVGAAVRAKNGKVYVGVNCDSVSHGACAEVIAIGSAVTAGEREFDTIVAVLGDETGKILPPCGNCRQMMYCYDKSMHVIVSEEIKVSIPELLKYPCD